MATIYLQDIDIYGREQNNGAPYEALNEEAVKNALTLWLTSKSGDFIRNPLAGGLLDKVLFKNMHGKSIGLFLFALKNALFTEFSPEIKVIDLQIERDYQYRTLRIEIKYIIQVSNTVQNVVVYTKDSTPIEEQKEQIVAYIGYNLYMFCIIRKPSMGDELLKYYSDENTWRWGIYRFSNFTVSDSHYSQILSICNE